MFTKRLQDNAYMSATGPAMAKVLLRQEIRTRRRAKATERDRRADGEAIARAVLAALPQGAGTVAAYVALPSEPPTDALVEALVGRGIQVLLPVLLPDNDLDWRAVDHDGEHPAALGRDAIGRAEVIVTPALGVDRSGTRLGQGGGSYDRALARRAATARVVALLHDGELVDGPLPREDHDARVHAVVTAGQGLVEVGTG